MPFPPAFFPLKERKLGKGHFLNFKVLNVPKMIHCVFKWLVPGDPLLLNWVGEFGVVQ